MVLNLEQISLVLNLEQEMYGSEPGADKPYSEPVAGDVWF